MVRKYRRTDEWARRPVLSNSEGMGRRAQSGVDVGELHRTLRLRCTPRSYLGTGCRCAPSLNKPRNQTDQPTERPRESSINHGKRHTAVAVRAIRSCLTSIVWGVQSTEEKPLVVGYWLSWYTGSFSVNDLLDASFRFSLPSKSK